MHPRYIVFTIRRVTTRGAAGMVVRNEGINVMNVKARVNAGVVGSPFPLVTC